MIFKNVFTNALSRWQAENFDQSRNVCNWPKLAFWDLIFCVVHLANVSRRFAAVLPKSPNLYAKICP